MGAEIAALMGFFFGITGAFALIGTVLAGWMAWRIVEKAGLPGLGGARPILLSLDRGGRRRAPSSSSGCSRYALAAR